MSGAVSGGDGAGGDGTLRGDIACGGVCACSARSAGDDTDCRGGLAEVEISTGWTAEVAGALCQERSLVAMSLAATALRGDGTLRGDIACGGVCACSARSAGDDTDCRGGLAEIEISAGWTAGVAGAHMSEAVSGGDGVYNALRGDTACGGVGACSAMSTGDDSDGRGGVAVDSVTGWLGREQQPSICRICLFLANTAARLLARVASV
jgi:hypothetical protein